MEFEDAASYFDQTPVYDGYTGVLLFYGRTSTHDDHSSSGATSRRRTLTAIPTSTVPTRGVVAVHEDRWLVGTSNLDNYLGSAIRRSFDLKKVTDDLEFLTPGEAALGLPGTHFYARLEFYRDQTDTMTDADYDTMWNAFCPSAEPLHVGMFLRTAAGRLLRIRNHYQAQERLHIAEADQLDEDAWLPVTFTVTGELDLATDSYPTVTLATSAVMTGVAKYYRFRTQSESDYRAGDQVMFVAKSAVTPQVGSQVQAGDATWRVLQIVSEQDAWALRVRRA